LYTGARIQSIIDTVGAFDHTQVRVDLLDQASEFDLIKTLSNLPNIIQRAKTELAPHLIAKYCFELAQQINSYYAHTKIVTDTPALTQARAYLLMSASAHLQDAMSLIGMKFVTRM
jgi:arginyl-tRNA synthetase